MNLTNATQNSAGADVEAKSAFDNDRDILARLGKKQLLKVKLLTFWRV